MAKNIFLDKEWSRRHLKEIKQRAGGRYSPNLSIDLPIAEVFDSISRTKKFYTEIRKHHGKLNREFNYVSSRDKKRGIQNLYEKLKKEIFQLSEALDKVRQYNTKEIPWAKIHKRTVEVNKILYNFLNKLREERYERLDIYRLREMQKEIEYFGEILWGAKAKLSNSPFLVLTGEAGVGKTHLLCDVVENRLAGRSISPAVLVFGELFETSDEPFTQIIRQIGLRKNKGQFLRLLNSAGRQAQCRAILAIDALNETSQRNFWKRNLPKVVDEIKKYPNIALVVSVRSGFEKEAIATRLKEVFVREEHQGFKFREWEAVSKFFEEFHLPLPEIPLLMPEFQNPLFLLLFCKAFEKRAERNIGRRQKQIFRGHEGATYIFENFVKNASKKIAATCGIPNSQKKRIWNMIVKRMAEEMVNNNSDRVYEDQMITLIKKAYPSIDYQKLLQEMERNLLITKVARYSPEIDDYDGFYFRFPFQRFSDHLTGRYIFNRYEDEFDKENRNLQTAKKFFSKRRKFGKFLAQQWNMGIVTALSIQCPERLEGLEFVDVAPYLRDSFGAQEAFLESLIWRKITGSSSVRENTRAYINEIAKRESGFDDIFNSFLVIAPILNHPFNADFLHKRLLKDPMPERDSWWSSKFLHSQYVEKGNAYRLIEWAWSSQDKSHINDESVRLCAVAMCWFLTTPNRFLRDKTTKALVTLLTNKLPVVLKLLEQFKDVDDPYLVERLYAVAYGCAMRSKNDKKGLKDLSEWIYDEVFKHENPPVHILLRDYARGVIEVALHEKINLLIDRKKIEPPFTSNWPKRVPSKEALRKKYYPSRDFQGKRSAGQGIPYIWSSVMYAPGTVADFGNYVLNPAVDHWSGRKLSSKQMTLLKSFGGFKRGLTENQRKEWGKWIREGSIDFENSLPEEQKKFFRKKISPFFDGDRDINDPFERFDTGLAQRWVFNRVMELGWKQDLHERFDEQIKRYYDVDSAHKPERIGKKYQWIALHELLARISDNFEFKDESYFGRIGNYEGPWQLSVRDIDPSCILKIFPNKKSVDIPVFVLGEPQGQCNVSRGNISDSEWLKKRCGLPNPKKDIEFKDEKGIAWVVLEGSFDWEEETPPEYEKYSSPTRRLYYLINSYLVHETDRDKLFEWVKKQSFMNRWMPEAHEFYQPYLGEYPWAPAFLCHHIGWTDDAWPKQTPSKVLVTNDLYVSEGVSKDCSVYEGFGVRLPAKLIVEEMRLTQNHIDGRFFDKNENLVVFNPSAFDDDAPKAVFIRKDILGEFMKRKNYALVWTLLGEKNMVGGGVIGQPLGILEINGAYTLVEEGKIMGRKRHDFREFK